jgi:type II secretory pathway component PulK
MEEMDGDAVKHRTRHSGRRAIILPLALLVLGLLAVLAAQVVFRSNADVAAVQAAEAALKARLAAEAGVQKVIAVLQANPSDEDLARKTNQPVGRIDMDAWYDNRDYFYGQIVQGAVSSFSSGVQGETVADKPSWSNPATWRFSIVGNDPLAQASNLTAIRYGVTDEASRLNLNTATRQQLTTLIQVVLRNQQVNADDLVKAIDYWRSAVPEDRLDEAEEAYYQMLDHPYAVKHEPFDSVEELLMVRGITGQILFGEDWNRNGMLDANENDGDASFPPDNANSQLDVGLYPFLTVRSSEPNTSNLNRPRVYLNQGGALTSDKLPPGTTEAQVLAINLAKTRASLKTPLDLVIGDGEHEPAFGKEDLDAVLDDYTTVKAQTRDGLVNVNTAPVEVLQAIGFTEDEARRIVTTRASLAGKDKATLAWLIQQGVLDMERLNDPKLFNCLTARAFQFRVESIGFADHIGAFCRLEVIIKMNGRICQIASWRDLSGLGLGWPVRSRPEGSTLARTSY